ncbi:MAG: hypothetical protein ACFHHU_07840 [Porticoccaceae bacterium]
MMNRDHENAVLGWCIVPRSNRVDLDSADGAPVMPPPIWRRSYRVNHEHDWH